jgi:hypothetical protein
MNATASQERVRAKRTKKPSPALSGSEATISSRVYGKFWELPVALVLAVLWTTGAVVLGLCAAALYLMLTGLA